MIICVKAMDQVLRLKSFNMYSDEEISYKIGNCIADCFVEGADYSCNIKKGIEEVNKFMFIYLSSFKKDIAEHMVVDGLIGRLEDLGIFDKDCTLQLCRAISDFLS